MSVDKRQLFRGTVLAEQGDGLRVRSVMGKAGEPHGVAKGRALDHLVRALVVARKLYADEKIRAAIQQNLGDGEPTVVKLGDGVEDWGLPA